MKGFYMETPCNIMISGSSSSGKSRLVEAIVGRLGDVFDRPAKQVIICYGRDQTLYDDIKKNSKIPIELVRGIPENLKTRPRTLLVIDDLQEHADRICDYFTKIGHHSDLDIIYITQNLFLSSNAHRTASLNSHCLIILKNPRDRQQVYTLSRQISPDNPKFILSAYQQATERPHGYLVVNLKQNTPEHLRIRDSIFWAESSYFVDKNVGVPYDLI